MGIKHSKKAKKPTSTPPSFDSNEPEPAKIYVALYDYEACDNDAMSFREQDQLEILDDTRVRKGSIPNEQFDAIFSFLFRQIGGMLPTWTARKDGYLAII
jgi:hypothetical protein